MATARTIQLTPRHDISTESTNLVNKLLQQNHENHHIFFNQSGFHNHIVHHLLSLWALKASPDQLQTAYDANLSYQRPLHPPNTTVVEALEDGEKFPRYLGQQKHYGDFLEFFQRRIEAQGWQDVVNEYVFSRRGLSDNMLARMFAGFLHPLIHLGFGVEFEQPSIVAEALAQAACHSDEISGLFAAAETAAAEASARGTKSIVQLLDELHADQQIRDSVEWSDDQKVRDGVMARAGDRMIAIASQVRVGAAELAEKAAEMTNAAFYFAGGAQRADRHVKWDFYLIHATNCTVFFPAFLRQEWLGEAEKVRLLEWKIRLDLVLYASQKSPEIRLEDVRNYRSKKPASWEDVVARVCGFVDDGHASKLVRAIANGEHVSKPYEGSDAFRLKGGDWHRLGLMAIDSVETSGPNWVRSAGFDEAWAGVPKRAQL